jgi:hypothetical protein
MALLLVCGGTASGAPTVDTAQGVPRAHVPDPIVDLGVVSVGEEAPARFAVENTGGGVLEILRAEPGCRCAVTEFDRTIAAGQVGYVRARLDTTELLGPVTKGIVVETNDPDRRKIVLTLKANVVGSVTLLPQPHIFMVKREGQPYVGRLLIRKEPSERGVLAVSDVTLSVDWLTASVERLEEPRPRGGGLPAGRAGDWVLELRFAGDEPVFGRRRGQVRFRTGLTRQPEVRVEVESSLRAPVPVEGQEP